MKNMIKLKWLLSGIIPLAISFLGYADDVISGNSGGGVNWTKGVIHANGYGVAPQNSAMNKKRLLARRAAQVDAYRNLAEVISGVRVSSETVVRNLESESDVIKTKINAVVRGATITDEHYQNEIFTVSMQIDMNGGFFRAVKEAGIASEESSQTYILDTIRPAANASLSQLFSFLLNTPLISTAYATNHDINPILIQTPVELEFAKRLIELTNQQTDPENQLTQLLKEEIARNENSFNYSGIVIDASNVKSFEIATIPRIRDIDGNVIYPSADLLGINGLTRRPVSYDFSLDDAIFHHRVSKNPFVIKASSTYKARSSDLIISKKDADFIASNSLLAGLMNQSAVMIVVGE